MTSADEKIAKAIRDNGCPLTETEIEIETGLRPAAITNGLIELLRQQRVKVVRDGTATLWMVAR